MKCPICQLDLNGKTENDVTVHVNSCLDTNESSRLLRTTNVVQLSLDDHFAANPRPRGRTRAAKVTCPICGKLSTATHVKKCQKDHNVLPRQTINLMRPATPTIEEIITPVAGQSSLALPNGSHEAEANAIGRAVPIFSCVSYSSSDPPILIERPTVLCEKNVMPSNTEAVQEAVGPPLTTTHEKAEITNEAVLSRFDDLPEVKVVKKDRQTKLRVTKKKRITKKDGDISVDKCGPTEEETDHDNPKMKYVITLKTQPNPLQKPQLQGRLLRNYKEYTDDDELPVIWKMSNTFGEPKDFICKGFEEFCEPPNLKNSLTGFFLPQSL
jgi:hypothetical protein